MTTKGEEALSRVTTTLTLGAAEVLLAILFCVVRLLALAAKPLRAYVDEHRQGEATGEEDGDSEEPSDASSWASTRCRRAWRASR